MIAPNEAKTYSHIFEIFHKDEREINEIIISSFIAENFNNSKISPEKANTDTAKKIEQKVRAILFLGFSYYVSKVKVGYHTGNKPNLWVENLEFDKATELSLPLADLLDFINLLLECPNALFALEMGLLKFVDVNGCANDGNKQTKLGLLDNRFCFEYFKKGRLSFNSLCALTSNQEENIKSEGLFNLVRGGIITFDGIISIMPDSRKVLSHPVVVSLLLDRKINLTETSHIKFEQLKNLKLTEPESLEKFVTMLKQKTPPPEVNLKFTP